MSIPSKLFTMTTSTVKFTPLNDTGEPQAESVVDFSDHIEQLTLTPATGAKKLVISGRSYGGSSTWSASLGLVQDLDAKGMLRFLMENEGKKYQVDASFQQGADSLRFIANISPASIGGSASTELPTSSVTLEIDGKPEWISSEEA